MLESGLGGLLAPLSWAVFLGATAFAILLGAVLAYHWFKYAMNPPVAYTALLTYAIVTGFLLSGLLGATIAIQIAY
ncbi:MAG: hypothetical protein WA021_01250 [Minisyncoccia bacterium]